MAKSRKNKYTGLHNIILGALVFVTLGILVGGLAQAILVFMLTGLISGTTYVVPVWGMFTIYAGIAGFILLTYLVDYELEARFTKKHQASRLPRRRYSHI